MQTSTPIVTSKNDASRKNWQDNNPYSNEQINAWLKYRNDENNKNLENMEDTLLIDFSDDNIGVNNSLLNMEEPCGPSPITIETISLPSMIEAMEITDSFANCSMSTIVDSNFDTEESTMIAEDSFTSVISDRYTLGPKEIEQNNISRSERRLSTVPTPFSFESREQSRQERRDAKQAYKVIMEEMNKQTFKAKPAPKSKPRIYLNDKKETLNVKRVEKTGINRQHVVAKKNEIPLSSRPPRVIKKIEIPPCFQYKSPKPNDNRQTLNRRLSLREKPSIIKVVCPKNGKTNTTNLRRSNSAIFISETTNSISVNLQPKEFATKTPNENPNIDKPASIIPRREPSKNLVPKNTLKNIKSASSSSQKEQCKIVAQKKTLKAAMPASSVPLKNKYLTVPSRVYAAKTEKPAPKTVQIKKTRVMQGSSNKQSSTIAKSPNLATAKRAQQRRLYEEMAQERDRQRQERIKQETEEKKAREREELARLRKQTVHKARPIPQYKKVLPNIAKRALTEPITPMFVKRRRILNKKE